MKKPIFLTCAIVCVSALAAPRIDGVPAIAWDEARHALSVSYRLADEPAIVTVSIQTNAGEGAWADVDPARVTRLAGAVNRLVQPDAEHDRTILWMPDADMPATLFAAGAVRAAVTAWPTNAPPPYMAVDLHSAGWIRYYACSSAVPEGVCSKRYKTDFLLLRKIEANGVVWKMGAPSTQPGFQPGGWDWTLETRHQVTLGHDYYMAVYEFTQAQYQVLKGSNPSAVQTCEHGDAELHPVDKVSVSALIGGSGSLVELLRAATGVQSFNLPTGAEWEYACRAGHGTGLYTGEELEGDNPATSARLDPLAWYEGNSGNRTHAVGQKAPNAWGLYDTLGNVDEATRDYFKRDLGTESVVDPEFPNPVSGEERGSSLTTFGGLYGRRPNRCRPSCRNVLSGGSGGYGFRVMCLIEGS